MMLDFNTVQVGDIIQYTAVNKNNFYYLVLKKSEHPDGTLILKVLQYLDGAIRQMKLGPLDMAYTTVM